MNLFLRLIQWLFGRKRWKTSPRILGGASHRPWTKAVTLSERGAFDRAHFGKYDRPGRGRLLVKWLIILPLIGVTLWFVWESLGAIQLF